jgi:splicing suppressor protein 51
MSTCAHCSKPGSALPPASFKKCAKCKATLYCSRDCQKADWQAHKKLCDRGASAATASPPQIHTITDPPPTPTRSPSLSLSVGDYFLHTVQEQKEVYCRLIDSYRLRLEDERIFEGNPYTHGEEEDPLVGFRKFVDRAEATGTVLPTWWNRERRGECEKLAVDERQWSDLNCPHPLQMEDVQAHYGDVLMPLKLRALAERICGRGVARRQFVAAAARN